MGSINSEQRSETAEGSLGLGLLDLIKQQFEPIESRPIWVLRCTGKPSRPAS
jgi:hypothetical protein